MTFHPSWFNLDQDILYWSYHQKSSMYNFLYLLLWIYCGTVFFGIIFAGKVSLLSHIITESPMIAPKYLPFSQVHTLGFQT